MLKSISFWLELTPTFIIDFNYDTVWVFVFWYRRFANSCTYFILAWSKSNICLRIDFLFFKWAKRRIRWAMDFLLRLLYLVASRTQRRNILWRWVQLSRLNWEKWHCKFIIVKCSYNFITEFTKNAKINFGISKLVEQDFIPFPHLYRIGFLEIKSLLILTVVTVKIWVGF